MDFADIFYEPIKLKKIYEDVRFTSTRLLTETNTIKFQMKRPRMRVNMITGETMTDHYIRFNL